MGRRLIWFVVAPLVVLGSEAAHGADYWIEDPDPADRAKLLEQTGQPRRYGRPRTRRTTCSTGVSAARWTDGSF